MMQERLVVVAGPHRKLDRPLQRVLGASRGNGDICLAARDISHNDCMGNTSR